MGFVGRLLRTAIRALSLEDPSQPLLPPDALFESLGLGRSDAGVLVNEKQAMRLTTAFGCIKIISEDLSRLPFEIFQDMPDGSLRMAKEHRLWPLLHDRPNPNMSSQVWRMAMHASCAAYGNAYSWIKRDKASRPTALVPLASDKTSPVYVRDKAGNKKLLFSTTQTENGQAEFIDPEDVLHFMGLTTNGLVGLSPIGECKNAFGLALAAEKFGAQFFGNGARSTGVLTHPLSLGDDAYENIKKSVREWATGEQALRPLILEEGMDWKQITIPPDEAQFLQTRRFQKEEVACLYRVPMHLLQDLQRATNNNIEHQGLDYVRFCLAPRAVNFEQEVNYKLLGNGDFIAEHNFMDLQRGDFATQTQGLNTLRMAGIFSTNRCLRQLREAPIRKEEGGDLLIVQGAMIPLSSLMNYQGGEQSDNAGGGQEAEPDSDAGDPAGRLRRRVIASYTPLFVDAVGRLAFAQSKRTVSDDLCNRIFFPILASMVKTYMAARFGFATLTARDESRIAKFLNFARQYIADTDLSANRARATELLAKQAYESLTH